MKLIFSVIILTMLFFSGCTQKQPEIKYIYQTRIQKEYVYVPCKNNTPSLDKKLYAPITKSSKKVIPKKSKKLAVKKPKPKSKKLAVKQTKPKYKKPKPTKIYAPKKYIKMPNKTMDFMVGINKDGSEFIYMEGGFGTDTYNNFIKFRNQSGSSAKEVKINSNGGLVSTAMQLGSFIKENKWNTGVDKEMRCMSACTFVYFAGRYKSLEGKAVLGLHRPYIPGVKDTVQSIRQTKKDYISYWNYIHAPKSIYDEMMEVGRDDLFILDKNNIDEYIDVNIK